MSPLVLNQRRHFSWSDFRIKSLFRWWVLIVIARKNTPRHGKRPGAIVFG